MCLLGLDDGSFPRHIERDGDDLTALSPRVGDRDVRSEDRQLLLDALLAARDHLVITYSGRDERSNLHRPPAVPVGELLDVVDHTVRGGEGPGPRRHRGARILSSRSTRGTSNPAPSLPADRGASTRCTWPGPRRRSPRARPRVSFLANPLPPYDGDSIGLDQLERFVRHPVRAFLRERLTVSLRGRTRDFEDAIPIELDALDRWQVADRVLQAQLDGGEPGVVPDGRGGSRRSAAGAAGRRAPRRHHRLARRAGASGPEHRLGGPVIARRARRAARRADPGRHGGRVARRRRAHGDLLQTRACAAPHRVAPSAGADGDATPTAHSRRAPSGEPEQEVHDLDRPHRCARRRHGAAPARGRAPSGGTRRPVRAGHARAAAALLQDLGRLGRAPWPRVGTPVAAAAEPWVAGYNFDQEDQDAEHMLVLGEAVSFDDCSRRRGGRATTRRRGHRSRRPGSGSTRAGCGTACWTTKGWWTSERRAESGAATAPPGAESFDVCGELARVG